MLVIAVPMNESMIHYAGRFDIGEMGTERYGVDLLPGKSFDQLRSRKSPTALKNGGHVETHRIYGLPPFPTRMEYCCPGGGEEPDLSKASRYSQMLLIGCSDGCVTIIRITDTKTLFGYRKVRGILHEITNQVNPIETWLTHLENCYVCIVFVLNAGVGEEGSGHSVQGSR